MMARGPPINIQIKSIIENPNSKSDPVNYGVVLLEVSPIDLQANIGAIKVSSANPPPGILLSLFYGNPPVQANAITGVCTPINAFCSTVAMADTNVCVS